MNCSICGYGYRTNEVFCDGCGAKLNNGTEIPLADEIPSDIFCSQCYSPKVDIKEIREKKTSSFLLTLFVINLLCFPISAFFLISPTVGGELLKINIISGMILLFAVLFAKRTTKTTIAYCQNCTTTWQVKEVKKSRKERAHEKKKAKRRAEIKKKKHKRNKKEAKKNKKKTKKSLN
ncbi:MAG: hypothetical protein FWH08_01355 [Oscillospiraceae bacterium]|nr:hypothetical protein [Oscillospiraceae bacterium]